VATEVGQGQSNAKIAGTLHLSVPTVKTHVSAILTKLGLNNRVQIALLAHDARMLARSPSGRSTGTGLATRLVDLVAAAGGV